MSSQEYKIRRGSKGDLIEIRVLSEQLGYPLENQDAEDRLGVILEHPDHEFLVADADDMIVAWVHAMLRPLLVEGPHVFVGGLVVAESWRNQNIGEAMMLAIEAWGLSKGAGEVYVYSNVIREQAHRFYERIGYRQHKLSKVFRKSL